MDNIIKAGRPVSKFKITAEDLPLKLEDNAHFALFVVSDDNVAIINCKLLEENEASDCPFSCNCWDVPVVVEIPVGGIDFDMYDVYCGPSVKTSLD